MKLAVISFTERGSRLNRSVSELLSREGIEVESTALAKYAESAGLSPLTTSLHDWTEKMFESQDALLFIGATGIAVRSIAPFVADKRKDPAVVVMDEKGILRFLCSPAISAGPMSWRESLPTSRERFR